DMKQKTQVVVIRVLCAVFILLSVMIALNPTNLITTLMSLSWGALAGAFLGPFLYGLIWKKVTKASVWACFAVGIGITVSNLFLGFASPTMAGAIAIISSLIVCPVVNWITPKMDTAHVDAAFACYEERVTVPLRQTLAEKEA
ncbi:MAG: sodium:solute symporter, partial [Oscillospiraceae bacterium]|nr:sodium:solute symporter [Oscillospiraceae bacterium]